MVIGLPAGCTANGVSTGELFSEESSYTAGEKKTFSNVSVTYECQDNANLTGSPFQLRLSVELLSAVDDVPTNDDRLKSKFIK